MLANFPISCLGIVSTPGMIMSMDLLLVYCLDLDIMESGTVELTAQLFKLMCELIL